MTDIQQFQSSISVPQRFYNNVSLAFLEVEREDSQNCSMLCCVRQLCTMIRTQMWSVLTVLWIGFCHAGFISLCIDLFVCICV